MTWREDDNWKVVFPEQKIFIMKHHNWAFVAWDLARKNAWINSDSVLIHVDQHLDAALDGAQVPGLKEAKGLKQLSELTAGTLGNDRIVGIDNFIWAGFARETIQRILYVSPEEQDELSDNELQSRELKGYTSKERVDNIWVKRLDSVEMLEFIKRRNLLNLFTDGHSLILDLDLDYFAFESQTETGHTIYQLKDTEEIKKDLKVLKNLYSWDAITVALSPEDWYIGGSENAEYVLNLFLEEFELNLSQGKSWSALER
ncbi:UPF0489 family protein [Solibacillus sp. FSL W7-1472]|uniref:UPF0489 family protein n=1 Tax=unclassified Solibacillus TaxID=2637870 RepID=UPI0030D99B08